MMRITRKAILVLAAGVLLALPAGAQGARDAQAALVDVSLEDGMTREQMAGRYAALAGAQFQPPACVEGEEMFTDVPFDSLFCPWIEELARRGITGGCTTTEYCPSNPVNRAQMAVFIVKSMEACPTLDPTDEMIRVGGICIDQYEASIWDAPVAGNQITGTIPCNENGQDCNNIYARSVAGVEPRGDITWFQAQAALANSGKRLPTNAEWQMAVRGTPDHPGPCNTDSGSMQNTGANAGCVSDWGAFDMVGNVWEWVADWIPRSTCLGDWPAGYGGDFQNICGAAEFGAPGALFRGGFFGDGTGAGPFAVSAFNGPSDSGSGFGFRGAR